MSFQAYLDNIKAKTGKTPDDFKKLAEKKGLLKPDVKAGDIIAWLKKDFELGHGHAMAIYETFRSSVQPRPAREDRIEAHFKGKKEPWKKTFDNQMEKVNKFGNDIRIAPTDSYLSLLRGNNKFAIVQATTEHLDIGIKLKNRNANVRFTPSGKWNAMVTHRVTLMKSKDLDKEILEWLHEAYKQNSGKGK